ncbi:ABC transporter substrate-binding protein [Nonomuraea sp. NPDC049129]|uniref:ABC transporter substrate-binding protein n=1 Tax=Nonomuraea sp. NPDC049129 TaxID=3155272 RepID=UPI00340326B7
MEKPVPPVSGERLIRFDHDFSRRDALRLLGWGGALFTVPGLVGCGASGGSAASDSRVARQGSDKPIPKLTWAVESGPRSLDFNHAFDGYSWVVFSELAEPLVATSPQGKLLPKLAVSWEQPNPNSIVVTLRQGVKFWDGKPLTAEDVVWSLNRTGDPKVASEFAPNWQNVDSVQATSADKITIRLKEPDNTFIYNLRFPVIYQKEHGIAAGENFGSPTGLIMGTGPYQIKAFSPATGATMTRFAGYWGTRPLAEQIEVKVISDPDTLRLAIQSGDVAGTFNVPQTNASAWDTMTSASVTYGPSPSVTLLILDPTQAPFNDVHARQAIAYALDRPGIVRAIGHGHGSPANSVSSPFTWQNAASAAEVDTYFSTLPNLTLDLAAAKAELAKSATPHGFSVTVLVPSNAFTELSLIMQTLKENVKGLGITIDVKEVPLADWAGSVRGKKKPPMSIAGLSPLSPDPLSLVGSLLTGGFSTYAPSGMTSDLAKYKSAAPARQLEIAKKVVTQLSAEMPFVPIVYGTASIALGKDFAFTSDITGNTSTGGGWAQFIKSAS